MRPRIAVVLLFALVLASLFNASVFASTQINVTVDGRLLQFDVPPTIIEGRTLVPLRGIFEALGAEVQWENSTRTVTGRKADITVVLPIGSRYPTVNGITVEIDVPGTIVDGRTMVPARFIAESLRAQVEWDQGTRTVIIASQRVEVPPITTQPPDDLETLTIVWNGNYGTDDPERIGTYEGQTLDNKPHGQGTWSNVEGRMYMGEWRNGSRHGTGTYQWPNGQKYVGGWKDGLEYGQGTMTLSNGYKYVGEWKAGLHNGQGIMTSPDGMKYVGEWKDGELHGHGTLTLADGTKYVGEFANNSYHGHGVLTFPDGSKYIGQFANDNYHGQGQLYHPDGTLYLEGQWRNNDFIGN